MKRELVEKMESDHPGVYVPPPLIYVAFFLLSKVFQNLYPLSYSIHSFSLGTISGWLFITFSVLINTTAIKKFIVSGNTIVPVKPAKSLQTDGIYAYTRNPMYLGLTSLYVGLAFLIGNLWTFIFIPFLVIVIQQFVIKKEERYLERAFNAEYKSYKEKVRRWI